MRCEILHKHSIGIELTCWGGLNEMNGKWVSYTGTVIPESNVQLYKPEFRNFLAFEKYSDAQLVSLKQLLIYLCDKYAIPSTYRTDMWDVSKEAIGGAKGIWTHTSYRIAEDKQDCHPQSELITMLQSLEAMYNRD
jgi:hypothetical protein